jgi:large subunit ribosomal protein L31
VKEGVHPKYLESTISCACGSVVQIRATVERTHVDICSQCHPFYTGKKQQLVDRGGRIEQFKRRYGVEQDQPAPAAQT